MDTNLKIYSTESRQWEGIVSGDNDELARIKDCMSPRVVENAAREIWPLIRCIKHEQVPAAVIAALEGHGDAGALDANESELFDALLGETLETPSLEGQTFFAKLREKGGGVGYDERGRLVRGLPGGAVEIFKEAKDNA